jgi:hypothetical protein
MAYDSLLQNAYKALGNPIAMIDTSYNLLGRTENFAPDDPLWNELVQNGSFSHGTVNFFNTEMFIQAVADSEVVALLQSSALKYDRACGKLFDENGVQLGSINVVACHRPFEAQDFENMPKICEQISRELAKQLQESVFFDECVCSLLEGREGCGILRSEMKRNLYVAAADVSGYDKTLSHLAYLRDTFAALQDEFSYYIYLDNILILMSVDGALSAKKDMGQLCRFFEENNIYAGISSAFQDLFRLKDYYKQAINALNYGTHGASPQRVFAYDNYRLESFLSGLKGGAEMLELCHPAVIEARGNKEHYQTLYHFLLSAKNLEAASKNLMISQDELKGRLRDIQEKYAIDWDDGELLSGLLFSYKILNVLG